MRQMNIANSTLLGCPVFGVHHNRWITQFENILHQSYTEQSAYDFKQGFLRLDTSKKFDEQSFEKILKTLVGIANIRRGVKGYVLVGVADSVEDARRVEELYSVKSRKYENFHITGVAHEATALNKNLDQLFQQINEKVKRSQLSNPLREYVSRNLKQIRYFEKSVFIFEAKSQADPSHFDGKYYERHGNELAEVETTKFSELFRRFQNGL